MSLMRTTLTLDDDLAAALKELAHRTGKSFKQAVNETLRVGLASGRKAPRPKRYRLKTASLGGALPGFDLEHALRLSDAIEDEEIARKLKARK